MCFVFSGGCFWFLFWGFMGCVKDELETKSQRNVKKKDGWTKNKTKQNKNMGKSIINTHTHTIERTLLTILSATDMNQVLDTIENARVDVLCDFLPIIAFIMSGDSKRTWREKLIMGMNRVKVFFLFCV